jgi:hypothetical protein
MVRNRLSAVLLACMALAVGGCTVSLKTASRPPGANDVCEAALIGGYLVPDGTYGLALRDADDRIQGVIWPYGYAGRRELAGVVLLDGDGQVVAQEGDLVQMRGARGDDGTNYPCSEPELRVIEEDPA